MWDSFNTGVRSFSPHPDAANDGTVLDRSPGGYVSGSWQNRAAEIVRPSTVEAPRCHFEVFQADEAMVTSTRHVGGDWLWRLSDQDGRVLVEANGYRTEQRCRQAVAVLQSRAGNSPIFELSEHGREG